MKIIIVICLIFIGKSFGFSKSILPNLKWLTFYDELKVNGFGADYIKIGNKIDSMGVKGVYGEIYNQSIRDIIISQQLDITADDIMVDLGSGTGKITTQFAFETNCKQCIGIELGQRRHSQGLNLVNTMQQSNDEEIRFLSKKIELINGDILTVPWSHVTIVFVNAVCFPIDLWLDIENLLLTNCPKLKYLFHISPDVPSESEFLNGRPQLKSNKQNLNSDGIRFDSKYLKCPSSWDDENFCNFYRRT